MSCCFGNLFNCSRNTGCTASDDVAMRIVRATNGCNSCGCGCGGNYYITIGGCGCQDNCGCDCGSYEPYNTCNSCGCGY